MPTTIRLKSGEQMVIRARCANPECGLLLVSNGNGTSQDERTIKLEQVEDAGILKEIPGVFCVHCRP